MYSSKWISAEVNPMAHREVVFLIVSSKTLPEKFESSEKLRYDKSDSFYI